MAEELERFYERFRENVLPRMEQSRVTVSFAPIDGLGDVKFWTELGASVMLDKPILVLARNDSTVPQKLAQVADFIMWFNEGEMEELADRVAKWVKERYGG